MLQFCSDPRLLGPAGRSTYSLTDRSSHCTLQPSPSHLRTGSGPSAYLEARQVLRINRNTPILGRMALSPCLGPCGEALSRVRGRSRECSVPPPAARSPQNTSQGENKEGAIPPGRRGYRPAPALSCWRPAASPASSAPPWPPGPVATATLTLPVVTRKHFLTPRSVGESDPGARFPPPSPALGKPPRPAGLGGGGGSLPLLGAGIAGGSGCSPAGLGVSVLSPRPPLAGARGGPVWPPLPRAREVSGQLFVSWGRPGWAVGAATAWGCCEGSLLPGGHVWSYILGLKHYLEKHFSES